MTAQAPAIPRVGTAIPELLFEPSAVQLFQFSAATWNTHRIHYDVEYAHQEGYPGILVQSHLHACILARAVLAAAGRSARIERFAWRNRGIAVAGDRLTCSGRAASVARVPDGARVQYELEERNQRGELCVTAWATVLIAGGGSE